MCSCRDIDYNSLMKRLISSLVFILFLVNAAYSGGLQRGGWNNRYFEYSGQYPYFVGFDLQQLGSDTTINYEEKIDLLARYNINKIRVWLITSFLGNYDANRFPYAKAGHKWDLDKWDNKYWSRMRKMIEYAQSRGLIVEVSIFEPLGLRSYAADGSSMPYVFSRDDNMQGFGIPNKEGTLIPQFYQLDYQENGRTWLSVQQKLIDKTVSELGQYDNVYFEIMNEWPGGRKEVSNIKAYVPWMHEMIGFTRSKTSRIIGVHTHGYGYKRNADDYETTSAPFLQMPEVDALNFHFYLTDPKAISDRLHSIQQKGKMLINNEGAEYYDIDRSAGYPNYTITSNPGKLKGEIRHMWGHITAGGYFTVYHGPVPQLEGPVFDEVARVLQSARDIVERVPFYEMSAIRNDGSELDDLVTSGPGISWQVFARENSAYLVYFCYGKSKNDAQMRVGDGMYRYEWFDTRSRKSALQSGQIKGGGVVSIPAPSESQWDAGAGVVLIVLSDGATADADNN